MAQSGGRMPESERVACCVTSYGTVERKDAGKQAVKSGVYPALAEVDIYVLLLHAPLIESCARACISLHRQPFNGCARVGCNSPDRFGVKKAARVCVCVCVCVRACVRARARVRVYVCMRAYMLTCVRAYINVWGGGGCVYVHGGGSFESI